MHQNFISRHFSNLSGIIKISCKLATCPLRSSPIAWGELSGAGFSADVTTERDCEQCRRQMTVANSPVQWPSWTWCRKWWNHSWHSSRVTLNQRCVAFIRPRTSLVYRYHVISRTQSHSAVFGCSPSGWMPGAITTARRHIDDSWATSLLVGLKMYRAGGTDWGKNKVYFGNIVPKQWTLSGFVQHTSANSMYKDDNKMSQQQKVLHINKMLERVTHFQTSFSTGIQPLS